MEDFFEPCYESGHNVRWRIRRADVSLVLRYFEHVSTSQSFHQEGNRS